jgi:hypothetical protein
MNRQEAIDWCKEKACNFIDPVFPPPEDWMWCENGSLGLTLQCIHTVEEDNPVIYPSDIK